MLTKLATVVSAHGGNILRSVNNTLPDGGFDIRLVVRYIDGASRELLKQAYCDCGIEFTTLELV